MTFVQFQEIDAQRRSENPKLFLRSVSDPPASEDQLAAVELKTGTRLPEKYRLFLSRFGGGRFGYTNVFSANQSSDWYLPTRASDASRYLPQELLPVSDDFAGGLYVFKIDNGIAGEEIFYWNDDGGLTSTAFHDVFEFLASCAYN